MSAPPYTAECAEADATQGMPPPTPSPVGPIADSIHTQAQEVEVEGPSPVAPPNSPADKPDEASRVIFRNEFFEVRPSSLLGFGAFAAKELKYGDCILTERPLMRTTGMGLFKDFDDLDEEDKQIYMSLHGFSIKKDAHVVEKILRANRYVAPPFWQGMVHGHPNHPNEADRGDTVSQCRVGWQSLPWRPGSTTRAGRFAMSSSPLTASVK